MNEVTVAWICAVVGRRWLVLTTATWAPSRAALSINCLTMISRPYSYTPRSRTNNDVDDDGGLDGGAAACRWGGAGSGGHGGRPASV